MRRQSAGSENSRSPAISGSKLERRSRHLDKAIVSRAWLSRGLEAATLTNILLARSASFCSRSLPALLRS
jgi:hypothetical protein